MSVPSQPRFTAVVLLVSIMLTERWTMKLAFPQGMELAPWAGRGLSDCSPHWLEAIKTLSEGSLERQDREERERELLLRSCPT